MSPVASPSLPPSSPPLHPTHPFGPWREEETSASSHRWVSGGEERRGSLVGHASKKRRLKSEGGRDREGVGYGRKGNRCCHFFLPESFGPLLPSFPPSPPVSPCAGCWKRTEKPKRGSFERGPPKLCLSPPSSLHLSGKKAGKGQSFFLSNL